MVENVMVIKIIFMCIVVVFEDVKVMMIFSIVFVLVSFGDVVRNVSVRLFKCFIKIIKYWLMNVRFWCVLIFVLMMYFVNVVVSVFIFVDFSTTFRVVVVVVNILMM